MKSEIMRLCCRAQREYSERAARDVVRSLLEAVAHCHDRGIVHRDLKVMMMIMMMMMMMMMMTTTTTTTMMMMIMMMMRRRRMRMMMMVRMRMMMRMMMMMMMIIIIMMMMMMAMLLLLLLMMMLIIVMLQPANLLVSTVGEDSRLMLADFGLATKLRHPDDMLQGICGTLW
jgi:serine/threonine protein kinase